MAYAPHVKIPILLLNGQFDSTMHYREHQLPFLEVEESVAFADQWIRERTKRVD